VSPYSVWIPHRESRYVLELCPISGVETLISTDPKCRPLGEAGEVLVLLDSQSLQMQTCGKFSRPAGFDRAIYSNRFLRASFCRPLCGVVNEKVIVRTREEISRISP